MAMHTGDRSVRKPWQARPASTGGKVLPATAAGIVDVGSSSNGIGVLILLTALPLLGGCGQGTKFAEVTGTVRIDGVPTGGIQIAFEPQSQDPRVILPAAYGMTNDNGTYKLLRRGREPGAPVGIHHVRVTPVEREDGKNTVIHPRYQANNALWAEVKPGPNVIDFDLMSGKKPASKSSAEVAKPSADE